MLNHCLSALIDRPRCKATWSFSWVSGIDCTPQIRRIIRKYFWRKLDFGSVRARIWAHGREIHSLLTVPAQRDKWQIL